jgi:hypothetical protein
MRKKWLLESAFGPIEIEFQAYESVPAKETFLSIEICTAGFALLQVKLLLFNWNNGIKTKSLCVFLPAVGDMLCGIVSISCNNVI